MDDNDLKENINKIIGNNIKFIRKQNGMSQEQFAEKVGLSTQFVSDLERGLYGISLVTVVKICNIMKCSPSIIFANLIDCNNYDNNIIDNFMKLNDKNRSNISDMILALLNNQ